MDPLVLLSDCNFTDNLVLVEWDVSYNVRTTSLLFTLVLGGWGLVSEPVSYSSMQTLHEHTYHVCVRDPSEQMICVIQ